MTDGETTTEAGADLVIVGAGIAGLSAALHAADLGLSVVVLSKGPAWWPDRDEQSTSTFYAQGGVAVVVPDLPAVQGHDHDSVDAHLTDTVAAGAGLTDPVGSRTILENGWQSVAALMCWGTEFDRDGRGQLLRTREGGHSVRRIIHAGGDATGAVIQRALQNAVVDRDPDTGSISRHDDAVATAILCRDGVAVGVAYRQGETMRTIRAPHILLATGGAGQLYAATTNPAGATADGIALALRAGAQVADLEFIQFHPTMLYTPGSRGRATLVSEAVRGEGGRLVDVHGASVTAGVHPMGDLAPRDAVANAVEAAIERTGHPCVYLDISGVDDFAARFPTVTAGIRAAGIDIDEGRIPVVPGAHYLCGGVVTDGTGRTSVPGLLAAGEVARTGLHGANRLASNSLLEGVVMGRRAAETVGAARAAAVSATDGDAVSAERPVLQGAEPVAQPIPDRTELQDAMSRWVSLRRSEAGLAEAAAVLAAAPLVVPTTTREIEDAALGLVARAVITAARARCESRGTHIRTDHPDLLRRAVSRRFRLDGDDLVEVVSGP